MFDRYMIVEEGFRNVVRAGSVTGFEFGARLPYYRGLGLSMVEDLAITVDGEKMPREHIRLTLRGRTYSLKQMETEYEDAWQMGEVGVISVERPGGLEPGPHKLELYEQLRVSYMPVPVSGRDSKTLEINRS